MVIIEAIIMLLTFNYKICIFCLESDKSQNYIIQDTINKKDMKKFNKEYIISEYGRIPKRIRRFFGDFEKMRILFDNIMKRENYMYYYIND